MLPIKPIIQFCCILLFLLHLQGSSSSAQRQRPGPVIDRAPIVFLKATCIPGTFTGASRVDISYQIPLSFFVFVHNMNTPVESTFVAKSEFSIELLDSTNSSVARDFVRNEIIAAAAPLPRDETTFQSGIFSFNLKPGTYILIFEVKDSESKRLYRDDAKHILVKNFSNNALEISDLILSKPQGQGTPSAIAPYNLGTDIPFGKNADCFFYIRSIVSDEAMTISYSLMKSSPENSDTLIVGKGSVPVATLTSAHVLRVEKQNNSFRYVETDSLLPNTIMGHMYLQTDTMEQGNYTLEITARRGHSSTTSKQSVSLRWVGMPFSLRALPLAVNAMKYLLSDDEFRTMLRSKPEEQKKKLDVYWKQRDQTPKTAYNEVMEEYYRRVDFAQNAFPTLKDENGVNTERGKVYVLYGPPSKIERKLLPSAPKEIWYYANLHKKLTFIDPSRKGEYRLESSENL